MRTPLTHEELVEVRKADEAYNRAFMSYLDSFAEDGTHDPEAGAALFDARFHRDAVLQRLGLSSLDELAPQVDDPALLAAPL